MTENMKIDSLAKVVLAHIFPHNLSNGPGIHDHYSSVRLLSPHYRQDHSRVIKHKMPKKVGRCNRISRKDSESSQQGPI